jgi:PHP family Zn ribbon phosphoesterase
MNLKNLLKEIHDRNGLAIASHIDRESYSIIGQLGFIPEDLEIDAVEISAHMKIHDAKTKIADVNRYPVITSSDAHFLEEIGKATISFLMEQPTIKELDMAFHNRDGRKIIAEP